MKEMTEQDLTALIARVATESVGPAINEALGPLMGPQSSSVAGLLAAGAKGRMPMNTALGRYPIGRKIRALAMGAGDPDKAVAEIRKSDGWRYEAEPTLKWLGQVKTSLTAGTAATAGDMIMPQYDPEWIELLRNNTVVRGIARTIPMPRGATSRRKQTAAATAYYQGETGPMTPSNLTVGRANLSYKKLTVLTVVSNDLIRFSGGDADRIVQEDVLNTIATREDRAFLVGNPPVDAGSPQGIRYQTDAANVNVSAGASLANFQADLAAAVSNVESANVAVSDQNGHFIMSPATFWTIWQLVTTSGDQVFARGLDMNPPRILGFPVLKSTALNVSNSWIGANAGLIFFVHAPSLEIHDSLQRAVSVFPGGAYADAAGVVASGISNDETVVTGIGEHDFLLTHSLAASIITGLAT